jgi:IrrE N-terminal-like domain
MRLRAELNVSVLDPLEQDRALNLIPNCQVWALKNIPGLAFEVVNHFRTAGFQLGAFAYRDADGDRQIVFNDAHPPAHVRVHLMEELFHFRLGHAPDVVRLYPIDGRHRTHNDAKEDEAYGCGIAALVPSLGLEALLVRGYDPRRIAEHYVVPLHVVDLRLAATKLGHLVSRTAHQLPLLMSSNRSSDADD